MTQMARPTSIVLKLQDTLVVVGWLSAGTPGPPGSDIVPVASAVIVIEIVFPLIVQVEIGKHRFTQFPFASTFQYTLLAGRGLGNVRETDTICPGERPVIVQEKKP